MILNNSDAGTTNLLPSCFYVITGSYLWYEAITGMSKLISGCDYKPREGKGTGKGSLGVRVAIITNDSINTYMSIIRQIHQTRRRSSRFKPCARFSQKSCLRKFSSKIAFHLETTLGGRSAGAHKPPWSAIKKQLFSNILHTVIIPTPTRPALIAPRVCVCVCVVNRSSRETKSFLL